MTVTPQQDSRTDIDPITYEVIRHKLWSINSEGATTVEHVSGSPVVHATDYNFGIYTATGEMAVVGVYLLVPIYTGAMAIREFLTRYDDIAPGDVFIINDPYVAAEHQNDVQFCTPLFDDDRIVAWLSCMAHQVDIGGMDPGSWCTTATDVYQEGLRIPPGRIVRRGEVNQELWDVVMANSRVPFTVANDFRAFLAGLRVASERFDELCHRYGYALVEATMAKAIDHSDSQLREILRSLPDGVFEHTSYLDRPAADRDGGVELLEIPCVLTKSGDTLTFDFSGAAPQSPAYGMATRAGTIGAIATLMLCTFGSEVPWNHGLMRAVTMVAPDGLCVTAQEPMPVSGGAAGANWVAMSAAAGCLAKLMSFSPKYSGFAFGPGDGSWQLSQFGGTDQYGQPFASMYMDSLLWGGPAFSFRDGVDSGGAMVILGGGTQDVEQQEMRSPLLYLWRREVPDSGGAGTFRGGNGIEFALTPIDTDGVTGVLGTHGVALPNRTGIFGGLPGSCAQYRRVSGSDVMSQWAAGRAVTDLDQLEGRHETLQGVTPAAALNLGDVFNCALQNGGGYGDPLHRDPGRVADDVAAGAVAADTASRIYGVVLDPNGQVDAAATEAMRESRRQSRRERMIAPEPAPVGTAPVGTHQTDWGSALTVSDGIASCAHCRATLGDIRGGWETVTGRVELTEQDLPAGVRITAELRAVQYICPHCGTSLWVEVVPAAGKNWSDFSLVSA
jgi:N-methylhydantoinase B